MELSIKEKKILFAFGCPSYRNIGARLKAVATLAVNPGVQTMWCRIYFYNLPLEMKGYHNAERDIYLAGTGTMRQEV